jgi:hypothetical protein
VASAAATVAAEASASEPTVPGEAAVAREPAMLGEAFMPGEAQVSVDEAMAPPTVMRTWLRSRSYRIDPVLGPVTASGSSRGASGRVAEERAQLVGGDHLIVHEHLG